MNKRRVILACDESGAKGYADQTESYPGEVGVFAAILVPEEVDIKFRSIFQKIYDKYKPVSGKLHISELPPVQQESLRQDVYAAVRKLKLPCFWYAIHVEGLHDWHETQKKVREAAKAAIAAQDQEPRVKRSSTRDNPASMHEELFGGLYAHLIAFLAERGLKEVSIEIRTDQVDSPIVKNFEAIARRLLSEDPVISTVRGFDTVTRRVIEGNIRVEVTFPPDMEIDIVIGELSINTVIEGDGYVLAADVIANSINHLFKCRDEEERYTPLNHPSAVIKHPLSECLDAFFDWGEGDLIGDRLYRHPKGRTAIS